MYSTRRSGPVADLHNAHTVSTMMRTMSSSGSTSHHRHLPRSRTSANRTPPIRSFSTHQAENRDRDIERLPRVLDGACSADVLTLEAKLKSKEKVIARQNVQIDFLLESNRTLERRLQELAELKRTLTSKQFEERLKNDDLLRDLKDIDRLARQVQADREQTVDAADRELTEAKLEIEHNHRELQALEAKVTSLITEKKHLIDELELSKSQYAERDNDVLRVQELLERLQMEKAKLSRRVSKLVHNEKELLQELQRCRRTTKPATPAASGSASPRKLSLSHRLDIHMKNVEDERDMYKHEVELLQRLLGERPRGQLPSSASPSRVRPRSFSPTPAMRSAVRRDMATSPVMHFSKRPANSSSPSPTRCTVCGLNRHRSSPTKDLSSYDNQLRHLDDERDRFRREPQKSKRSLREKDVDDTQLSKVLREKEDLQLLLKKFERHMSEIQGNIKVLNNERDNLSVLYEQAKEELQRARHDLLQNAQTSKVSLAAQSILRKVENERDAAIVEARTAANERDSLRDRLRIATDTALNERARFEQRIEDLEMELRKLDHERQDIIAQKHQAHEQIKQLENRLHEQSFTISQLNQELNDQKGASAKLRYLSEEAEQLLEENQRQLNLKKEELQDQEEKIVRLETKIYEFQEINQGMLDDIHRARATIQALDDEKTRLGDELDLKSEQNVHLTQDVNAKIRRIEEMNRIMAEVEGALDRSKDETKQKLKEVSIMRMQLDRSLEESNEHRRQIDLHGRDNSRLQDDMLIITRDNQKLHQDLTHAIQDKENLKLQIQEYIKQVSNCESVISQKENDRTCLLEQYRESSNELSRAKILLTDMESQVSDLKQELQIRATEGKRVADRLEYLERELHKHESLGQEYELQLSNMNRSLQRNEEIIKKLQYDKQSCSNEMSNMRDINVTMESKTEQIVRQLTVTDMENDHLQSIIGDLKMEIDMLRTQVNNEKCMIQSLEEIIASLREKDFQVQVDGQQRDSSLSLANDRVNQCDHKIQTQCKEIAALRTEIIGLETDNKRLKSLLASERQERDRAAQDLRKLSDLTTHIDQESRYRSSSPRMSTIVTTSSSTHRSPTRSYSPPHASGLRTSPTKSADRSRSVCLDATQ